MSRPFATALFGLCLLAPAALYGQQHSDLSAYETCSFPDGLQITDSTPLPSGVHDRPVTSHGKAGTVPLIGGRRVLMAYPGQPPYANVKVEQLPAENFAANRKALLDDFDDVVASDMTVVRSPRKPTQSGFFIEGLDRIQLKGTTLGIYLLIDDPTHIASTVYFLYPDPAKSSIKTMADYTRMRDTFLYNYTRCIRNNQIGSTFGAPRK